MPGQELREMTVERLSVLESLVRKAGIHILMNKKAAADDGFIDGILRLSDIRAELARRQKGEG
jgi:hypothetical protein